MLAKIKDNVIHILKVEDVCVCLHLCLVVLLVKLSYFQNQLDVGHVNLVRGT